MDMGENMERQILELCEKFNVQGEYIDYQIFKSGHINTTVMVRFNVDNSLLVNGDAYMLIFPDGIEKHMFVINNDDGKYLVDILFEDIYGNTYRGEEKFVPELARIILTFTNNTTVTDITNITIDGVDRSKVFIKKLDTTLPKENEIIA